MPDKKGIFFYLELLDISKIKIVKLIYGKEHVC